MLPAAAPEEPSIELTDSEGSDEIDRLSRLIGPVDVLVMERSRCFTLTDTAPRFLEEIRVMPRLEGQVLEVVQVLVRTRDCSVEASRDFLDYCALERSFSWIKARYAGKRIGYPRLGIGACNADWATIAAIINWQLRDEAHGVVQLTDFHELYLNGVSL